MARQSDKEGERAGGKHQRYRRPTRPLCCRRHGDRRRRGFSSSPVEIVFPFTLLSALFFLCFFVSNTSSFTTGPTSCTANLGMKNAFPRTPGVFTRSPRQWWQEGTGGSSLSLSAVPSRSFKDDGQKLEGAEGFAGRKAELEPAGWAGSVVLLLQEALFSARRRVSLLSRWSSSSSSLSATTASATALTPTTRPAVTSNSPLVANSTPLTSSRRRFFCGPRGGGDSTGGAGGAGGSSGGEGGVGSRIKGGVRVGASLTRLACCVVLLPPVVSFGAGSAATAAAMGGGAGASAAGLGGAAAVAAVEGPFSLVSALLANQWYVWAVLMASSSAGLWSERTQWGAAVSSPLVTMLLTITLCNVGVLPAASPAYDTVNKVFVPLAVPLLLFDADLRKVLRFAGTLLACFVIGAAGTVIGTVAAAAVVPLGLGSDGWKIASALASRHIGGAVNYVAVCETLGVSADAVVAGLAADNMVVSLYFVFLFWITKPEKASPAVASTVPSRVTPSITSTPTVASTTAITATSTVTPTPSGTSAATPTVTPTPTEASAVKPTVKLTVTSTSVVTSTQAPRSEIPSKDITNNTNTTNTITNNGTNTNDNSNKQTHSSEPDSPPPTPPLPSSEVPTVPGVPLEQAQAVVEGGSDNALPVTKETISYAISAACALCLSGEILAKVAFGGKVSAIPLVTLATVAGATAAPSFIGKLGPVGAQLGVLFMQLFFAVTGAQGNLAIVLGTAPSLLVFSLVQIAVHFGVLVGVGKLCRLPFQELALASNANVGGPTTAAAMAAAKGWKNLVLPALLTGVLGYATATFIGVGMGHAMLKSLIGGAGG